MRRGWLILLLSSLFAGSVISVTRRQNQAAPPDPAGGMFPVAARPAEVSTLRSVTAFRGLQIGAAVAVAPLRLEPVYGATLKREFNLLVAENAMKFGALRPSRDRYDFSGADSIMAFARSGAMKVRGHTLVWPDDEPRWLFDPSVTRHRLAEILREHIATVVARYRGEVAAWDVINEAVEENGRLRIPRRVDRRVLQAEAGVSRVRDALTGP